MKKPIAVLLATYNGEEYLKEQLESIHQQTSQEYICYIHDDGSTDGTGSVIREYVEKYPDEFVELHDSPSGSARSNFLSMLANVDADYYMFCDQDDWWLPDKIEKSREKIKRMEQLHPGYPAVVFSDMKVADQDLRILKETFFYGQRDPKRIRLGQIIVNNVAAGCTMIFNRRLAKLVTRLTDVNHIFMHDGWVMTIAAVYGIIGFIDEPLLLYRQHGKNFVGVEKSSAAFLLEKLKGILAGSQIRNTRKGIGFHRTMASEIAKMSDLPVHAQSIINGLTTLSGKGKIKRVAFYIQNGLLKKKYNFWMLLWV